jgi:hypothetical protein
MPTEAGIHGKVGMDTGFRRYDGPRRSLRFAEHLPMLSLRAVFFVVDGLIILQLRHYIRREALHRVFDVGVGHGADVEPTEQLRRAGAGA